MVRSRATLPQVAERAGVSLSSASRALHGNGASAAMVGRVRAVAEELGYHPDATGRSLRMRRTFQIAFAVADIGNPVYVEMMTAIQQVVSDRGYRLLLATTGETPRDTAALVRGLVAGSVDGLVISPLRLDDELVEALAGAGKPVVVIGRPLADDRLDSVSTDSAGGIGQAVDHVVGLGRRRIGFLNGPLDTTPGEARQRGFDAAVGRSGPGVETVDTEVADDFTVTAGLVAARALLARHTAAPLDAVVAANDLLAICAVKAAREAGLRVPDDVAVTGMDDTELGRVFQPSLTSVDLGAAARGRAAAELLLGRLDDPAHERGAVVVAPRLVVRESTLGAHAPSAPPDRRPSTGEERP
ncbi:LacI family DNA-binding transcriptional regulator [Cellulomonas aerilata]|uniref:LacI family transcriptional regulator n=1 Tax=Cellulomonas aerilata TaxID=515326 RepID=A0A512DDM2_9CELL|nr:LacI family DNA-binding transcriptional regulator [Cellulomonas aerilata]GEO34578.1 LacI family transcriptional regulator [Cellulomonas aerilata]